MNWLWVALWNGRDQILKERLLGLPGEQRQSRPKNVKEYDFTRIRTHNRHSYMSMLYKYPQAEFSDARLVKKIKKRKRQEPNSSFSTQAFLL